MAIEIPFIPDIEGCVYKLWYSDRYVIVKCKTFWRSKQNIDSGLKYFLKNTPKGRKEEDFFNFFFSFILENPDKDFKIDILCSSNNPLDLLKSEHMELLKGKYDPRCLNKDFEPYIPKFTQVNGQKSWINRGYYLNYMNWKRKFSNQRMIE